MYRYEFTFSFDKPWIYVYKVVVDAFNDGDAYYSALYEIARHVSNLTAFEAPGKAKLTCVKKGKINGI